MRCVLQRKVFLAWENEVVEAFPSRSSKGAFPVLDVSAWSQALTVNIAGRDMINHAGAALRLLADCSGLTGSLSRALARRVLFRCMTSLMVVRHVGFGHVEPANGGFIQRAQGVYVSHHYAAKLWRVNGLKPTLKHHKFLLCRAHRGDDSGWLPIALAIADGTDRHDEPSAELDWAHRLGARYGSG